MLTIIKDYSLMSKVIDIVRGIAILLVILVHSKDYFWAFGVDLASVDNTAMYRTWINFATLGAAGVGLFFFISGYLIFMLYWDKLNLKKYVIRRVGRIFPLWTFWLLVSTIVATLGWTWWFTRPDSPEVLSGYIYGNGYDITVPGNIWLIISYLFFVGFINPPLWNWVVPGGWSIQTEVLHYTLFPLIRKVGLEIFMGILLLIAMLFAFYTKDIEKTWELVILSATVVGPIWFTVGMIFSKFVKEVQANQKKSPLSLVGWVLLIGLILVSYTFSIVPAGGMHTNQVITVIILSILVSFGIVKIDWLSKLFVSIGKYSYGIYFSHFLVVPAVTYWLSSVSMSIVNADGKISATYGILLTVAAFLISTIAAYLIALVTYHTFENRLNNEARQISSKIK